MRDLISNTLLLFKATTAYTSASTDARAALAPQLSGGARVRHLQSARRLWPDTRRLQLPLDDCCRLVLPYHAKQHVTDGTDPGWGRKILLLAIIPVPQFSTNTLLIVMTLQNILQCVREDQTRN